MTTLRRSRTVRRPESPLPGIVFTALFVAAFAGIFFASMKSKPALPDVADASYYPKLVAATVAAPKVWPLPVPPADLKKDALGQIALEGFDWKRDGFGMVSLVSFSIHNRSGQNAQNIEIACRYFAADGAALGIRKRQIYEQLAIGRSVAVPTINMGLIPDRAQTIFCFVSDAQLS